MDARARAVRRDTGPRVRTALALSEGLVRVGVISVVGDFHGERPTSSSNNVPDPVPAGMQIAGEPRRSFPPSRLPIYRREIVAGRS